MHTTFLIRPGRVRRTATQRLLALLNQQQLHNLHNLESDREKYRHARLAHSTHRTPPNPHLSDKPGPGSARELRIPVD